MNILITAASAAQAHKLSRFLNTEKNIFLGDSVDLPVVGFEDITFVKIPPANHASFSHLLLAQCLDLKIEAIYPLKKTEVLALAEARLLFDEYGIIIMVPDRRTVENYFSIKTIKGEIIKIDEECGDPDRGVFVIDPETNMLKLFTAD
ncbi:MAG TPA: hypothetical protein VGB63_07420 [Pedobacter sp.]